jgi:hypothetical protein
MRRRTHKGKTGSVKASDDEKKGVQIIRGATRLEALWGRKKRWAGAMILFALLVITTSLDVSFWLSPLFKQHQQPIQAFGQQEDNNGPIRANNHSATDINLSKDEGISSFFLTGEDVSSSAFMAASGNKVYVVWVDNSTGTLGSYDIFFARSTDGGSTFDKTIDISAPLRNNRSVYGASYSPQIAIAGGNIVYVVWIEDVYAPSRDRADSHILLAKSSDGGSTFQRPLDISGGRSGIPESNSSSSSLSSSFLAYPLYSSNPQIATSKDGSAYVVWTVHPLITATGTQQGRVGEGDIFFTKVRLDGSSAEPVNLSNNLGESRSPRIGSSGSNVYVAWEDDTRGDSEIFFRHISGGGATLGPVVNISNNFLRDDKPQIAVDGTNVSIIWQRAGKNETGGTIGAIGFASSNDNGTTFRNPVQVMRTKIDPIIGPLHHLAITSAKNLKGIDKVNNSSVSTNSSSTNAYVVWSDGTIGNRDIFFSKSNVTGNIPFPYYYWTLSNNTGESVLPQIATSGNGHVYVVWMDNSTGLYQIYLREANFSTTNASNDFKVRFSDTVNISNSTGNSMFPQILAEGNSVYVAWEEHPNNNNDSTNRNSEIHFRKIVQ